MICNKCGMMKDLCVCEVLDKQGVVKIKIYTTAKKFKKLVTVIEGIDKAQVDQTASDLKHKLACGGTAKDGLIILQGNHKRKLPAILEKLGYLKEHMEVS
ncbi:MAG: stress response translation initiation inhibitor YciH [Candidatus Micrarchaeota archaeon]